MRTAILASVLLLVVVGCGSDDPTPAGPLPVDASDLAAYRECATEFEAAAAVDDMQGNVEDLDAAIIACGTVQLFLAAAEDHPGALDGTDPETFLANRCEFSDDPAVTGSAICREVTP